MEIPALDSANKRAADSDRKPIEGVSPAKSEYYSPAKWENDHNPLLDTRPEGGLVERFAAAHVNDAVPVFTRVGGEGGRGSMITGTKLAGDVKQCATKMATVVHRCSQIIKCNKLWITSRFSALIF